MSLFAPEYDDSWDVDIECADCGRAASESCHKCKALLCHRCEDGGHVCESKCDVCGEGSEFLAPVTDANSIPQTVMVCITCRADGEDAR